MGPSIGSESTLRPSWQTQSGSFDSKRLGCPPHMRVYADRWPLFLVPSVQLSVGTRDQDQGYKACRWVIMRLKRPRETIPVTIKLPKAINAYRCDLVS